MAMTREPLIPFTEWAAQQWEHRPRRYPTPAALAHALDPTTRDSPALDLIDAALVELVDGDTHNALAVFLPPQEGKSQRISRRFPEWLLDHNPGLRIAIVSYELDLAMRWGRDIKQDIRGAGPDGLRIDIRRDSAAAARWETPLGGGVYSVGIGGPLTGRPVDVLIIDDPVKDRAAAESKTIRESTWDWYESVALTRLAPGAKVVLVQTRWHEDDLAGRIAARPSPLNWRVLSIPAIAGDDDPLDRAPGEELLSVRGRAAGHFLNYQANLSHYVFSGVYQQKPTAAEGNFFRRPAFRYWRPAPAWSDGRERIDCEGELVTLVDCWKFATMDLAVSSKQTADYTVCAVWAVSVAGDLILCDRTRDRVDEHQHFGMIESLRTTWGFDTVYIEQNYWATTVVKDARDAGVPVAPLAADTDKVTRAVPAAGRVHAGRVWFPAEATWLDEWCDELAAFPQAGAHDDQVDVLSYAARVITMDWTPASAPARPAAQTDHERSVALAARSATGGTGNGHGEIDLMNVPW